MIEIRNYTINDLDYIENINPFTAIQIQYHKGIKEENIICAVKENTIVGVAFLQVPYVFSSESKQKIGFELNIPDGEPEYDLINSLLLDGLIARFNDIKNENSDINICMRTCCETDEISDMQLYLDKGFSSYSVIPVLSYDLNNTISHNTIPNDIEIRELKFTEESMNNYVKADHSASSAPDDEADTWFRTGDPSFKCFIAAKGDEVIGAVSVWNITVERAATENIFVIPEYRRKNIAKELIATAFEELKSREMKIATLSVAGTNLRAINLYLSKGYKLYYNLIEMIYE